MVIPRIIDNNEVTAISDYAMDRIFKSEEVYLPKSIESMSVMRLLDGRPEDMRLKAFHVSALNPSFCDVDGVLYSKNKRTILRCPYRKEGTVSVCSETDSVGTNAFESCNLINEIELPLSIKYMGDCALSGFSGKINIPDEIIYIGAESLSWSKVENYIVPANCSYLGYGAFCYCNRLKSVTIEDGIEALPDELFFACPNLTELHLPSSVNSIGRDALYGCVNLTVYAHYPPEHYKGLQLAYDSYVDENGITIDKDYTIKWVTIE